MPTWRISAEDPRTTDELIRVALTELNLPDEAAWPAVVGLQFRPTREVLDKAAALCRAANPDERWLGVRVLGELRDLEDVAAARPAFVEESMEVLLELAESEQDIDVLAEIARAFGYRRDARGAEPLLRWRDHHEPLIRFFVASSLPRCQTAENEAQIVGALLELTDDEDGDVRDYALFGLNELELDSDEVRAAMLRHVDDPDTSAAGEALVGLARRHDERGIEPLKHYLLDSENPHIGAYGLEAATLYADRRLLSSLETLRENGRDGPDLEEAIESCTETQRS
jgi:HEAT repeat protein